MIVAEEAGSESRGRLFPGFAVKLGVLQRCAVDEENVLPAVMVVIEDCDAAPHCFDEILSRSRRVAKLKSQTRVLAVLDILRIWADRRRTRPVLRAANNHQRQAGHDDRKNGCPTHVLRRSPYHTPVGTTRAVLVASILAIPCNAAFQLNENPAGGDESYSALIADARVLFANDKFEQ